MIHTILTSIIKGSLLFSIFFLCGNISFGADSQVLSVTPPLFQLSAVPGDLWQSSIKVTNVNAYPLTIYLEVVNFEAMGENGQGKFRPILDDEPGANTLAHWITINKGPYTIPAEQTSDLQFFVEIPKDAPPGGHYAAILVSTQPPPSTKELAVVASQAITSLFFLRIEGEVDESGTIREFRTTESLLQRPEAEFSLRFENKGNVHLQPRGNIIITNMWGTERGIIPVNYQTHFGNVLPKSIRDFKFLWETDFNITDIGRYTAEATLAYGLDGVQSATAKTYFWVIPLKSTAITVGIVVLCIWIIALMVRAYIRRVLMLAGVNTRAEDTYTESKKDNETIVSPVKKTYKTVSAPLRSGVLDLRERLSTVEESVDVLKTIGKFIVSYKVFFISLTALIIIFVGGVLYISYATLEGKDYTVTIDNEGNKTILNAEQAQESLVK